MPSTEAQTRQEITPAELHLVIQLQDDLARARWREAFWISVVLHLLIIFALALSPKYLKPKSAVVVATPEQLLSNRELTYMELAPDNQKLTERPKTNIISDKDRIATSRRPTIDQKQLRELLDSRPAARPGPPGPAGMPTPQQVPQQPQVAQGGQHAGQQGGAPQQPNSNAQQVAKLEDLQTRSNKPNPFSAPMSAGSAIEQAARAARSGRMSGFGGAGGDYGSGINSSEAKIGSNLDVLSDTMGVDFGPYLSRVLHSVRLNWYTLVPEEARAPLLKQGKVAIEFAIMKNGAVAGMRVVGPSGDVALDRAAWGGITASNPFPPLPGEFRGDHLALRFHFYYNPNKNELR